MSCQSVVCLVFFFFKQKTAYEMRISDWSSDVCSSDLLTTFRHLHALGLRYHLDRRTGGLSRVIERGVKGIEFVLSFMLFNILPTLLEIVLVCGILWGLFDEIGRAHV